MTPNVCPFQSGVPRSTCIESECNLWMNGECAFKSMARNISGITNEIQEIKQRVYLL